MRDDSRIICHIDELPEAEAIGRPLPGGDPDWADELILLRRGDAVYVYRNSCPHTGAPLNWLPDRFFDVDGRYLQCSLHLALFEPVGGRCVHGPCAGQSLQAVAVALVDGWVRLAP